MVKLITMPNPSNAYADKIFSEHPIALWALDEELRTEQMVTDGGSVGDGETMIFNIKNVLPFAFNSGGYNPNTEMNALPYGVNWIWDQRVGHYIYEPVNNYPGYMSWAGARPLVENTGTPMVYGASNLSELYPYTQYGPMSEIFQGYPEQQPSLVLPGFGFMNKEGQNKEITFEFWLKVDSNYAVGQTGYDGPFRFFGPVASDDGLYADGYSMILKVGNFFVSHSINEWDRPMLVQIQLGHDGAALLINGDVVGQMRYDSETQQSFPEKYDNSFNNMWDILMEQDWLGFYAHEFFKPSIDCVAIYPSLIPNTIAKKRFAYGQAVEFPQHILSKHGGQAFNVDYSVANYVANYNYPTTAPWKNGIMQNVQVQGSVLSALDYPLPEFYIKKGTNDVTFSKLVEDTKTESSIDIPNNNFICFRPKIEYKSYAKFLQSPIGSNQARFLYVQTSIYNHASFSSGRQTVLKALDQVSGDYFIVTYEKDGTWGKYFAEFVVGGLSQGEIILGDCSHIGQGRTYFGIDLNTYAAINGPTFLNSDQTNIIIYVGGDDSPDSNSFQGEVYSFGLIDNNLFLMDGYLDIEYQSLYQSMVWGDSGGFYSDGQVHTFKPTYELIFKNLGQYRYPDIRTYGYWQDIVPMSRLSKENNGSYSFDFLQINTYLDKFYKMPGTYGDDLYQIIGPVKTWWGYSGSNSSAELSPSSSIGGTILPISNIRKTTVSSGGQVINGTVVVPEIVSENGYMYVMFEIDVDGIKTNPLKIKTLQIASQVNNAEIKSRTGTHMTAYNAAGIDNFYNIYKGSTPHNFMTADSGIQLLGTFNTPEDRGLRIPIPEQKMTALQFSYNVKQYHQSSLPILRFRNQRVGYENLEVCVLVTDGGASGFEAGLFAQNVVDGVATNVTQDLLWYIDGHQVTPDASANYIIHGLEKDEWSTIGISFPKPLDFAGIENHSLDIVGPGLFNNIVHFRLLPNEEYEKLVTEQWQIIKNAGTWSDESANTWESVFYNQVDAIASISPEYLYNLYYGLNKIVVESEDTNGITLSPGDTQYSIYKNASWTSKVIKPV